MKKVLFFIMMMTVVLLQATDVSGQQSGTWTQANNPYNVTGDITVPAGTTLTIEPGVIVNINSLFQITAQGNIIAEGTPADSIMFYSSSRWKGFRLENTSVQSSFLHCHFEKIQNAVHSIYSPLTIRKSYINNASENCLNLSGIGGPANMLVKQCKISGAVKSGIMITQNSGVVVDSCEIYGNGTGASYYGAIQIQHQSATGQTNPMISNNWIHHNLKQGITAWDVMGNSGINPTIINNLIENNLTGIYLRESSGLVKNNIVQNNFIVGNANSGAGIMIARPSAHPVITENTITGNYTGFYIGEGAAPNLGDITNAVPGDDGMNIITNNADANGTPHSVVIYLASGNLTADVMAQNNIWGTFDTNLIDISITDHNDNALMGTVNYLPLYLPYNVSGAVSYQGTQTFEQLVLLFYDLQQGMVTLQQPLDGVGDYQITVPVGSYLIQAIGGNLVNEELQPVVFGTFGGILNPTILTIAPNQQYNQINIEMFDFNEDMKLKFLSPTTWQNHTVFPLAIISPFGLDEVILLYEDSDYLYQAGEMLLNLESGQWEPQYFDTPLTILKNHNFQAGDAWGFDSERPGILNGQLYENISTPAGDFLPYRVSFYDNILSDSTLASRQYFVPDQGLVMMREFDMGILVFEQKLVSSVINGGTGLFPVFENNEWIMRNFEGENRPVNLSFSYDSLDTRHFCWDAPTGDQWTGYRIYRDNSVFASLPIVSTSYPVPDDYEQSDWVVKAFNNQTESDPSNQIQHTGNTDQPVIITKAEIKHYPNPIHYNTKSLVCFNISLPDESPVELSVFNIKGQKVASVCKNTFSKGDHKILWNGLSKNSNRLANGVYFYQLKTKNSTITRKMMIIK